MSAVFQGRRQTFRRKASASEDRTVLGEYLALLEYKLSRRDELDQHIEALALAPAYQTTVARGRAPENVQGLRTRVSRRRLFYAGP